MRSPIGTWISRILMVIFLIFLCSTGHFGRILAVLFSALVLFFAVTDKLADKIKGTKNTNQNY